MVMVVGTDGAALSRAQVAGVPVLQAGGGGFVLSFPLKPGDLGFIKANDRDISAFLQGLTESAPTTGRMHSFSDGVFVPAVLIAWTLNAGDANAATLQNLAGTVSVSVSDAGITLRGPVTFTGLATFEAGAAVVGTLTATVDVVLDSGVTLATAVASGVTPGTGTSGPLVPP